jgi:polyisoprenoid-binding protein YceI
MSIFSKALALGALAILAACSNPADNKPVATVADAVVTPAAVTPPAAAPVGAAAATTTATAGALYHITPDSKVTFVGSKVTGSHHGGFNKFSGEITAPGAVIETAGVKVEIAMDSIFTDTERLTGHLKSPDFFDVAKYPTATFQSTQIAKVADGYQLTGNLTLHGVTKSISFPAKITADAAGATATAEFVIKRKDFNIVYPGKPNDLIRDEVVIHLEIKAVPA